MTQSPSKINSTVANDKTLVKSVGYITIFWSDTNKIELSARGTSLRRTTYKNGIKQKEYLYVKIDNYDEIHEIENLGYEWKTYDGSKHYGYIVRGQLNKMKKLNGIYKVVEVHKVRIRRNSWNDVIVSIDSNIRDWTYYKRRPVVQ